MVEVGAKERAMAHSNRSDEENRRRTGEEIGVDVSDASRHGRFVGGCKVGVYFPSLGTWSISPGA